MAQQLRRGAAQLLDFLNSDLDSIEDYAIDNPAAVRKLARRMRARLRDELRPMLMRADDTPPSVEERIAALERQLAELKVRD